MAAKKTPASSKIAAKISDYKQVFGSKAGERVLHDLISYSHFLNDAFPKSEFEAGVASGQRSIVAMILKRLATDPKALLDHMRIMEERRQNER